MQGVQAALNLGIGRLILETNALMIKQAISLDAFDAMAEGSLLEELKFLVRVNFLEFECSFLSRVGNRAAHALAALRYVCVEGEELITRSIPKDVHVIVSDDLSDQ
jgi:Zn finger protein HypA/HybF involved in hydrogenase expression